jgi:hypothetical protein
MLLSIFVNQWKYFILGQKVRTVARQQVVSLPDNAARVLGAYPEDNKLYILHSNSLLVLSMAQD